MNVEYQSRLYLVKARIYRGPVFKKAVYKRNNCTIFFTSEGSGLATKDSSREVKEFAVATDGSHQFVKAKAVVSGKNTISVSSPDGKPVTAIRYAWADNPATANLINKEGLPAYLFRTDDFKGISYLLVSFCVYFKICAQNKTENAGSN